MLQIISGKFFNVDAKKYHTPCKVVLYSNLRIFQSIQFGHMLLEPTEIRSDINSYVVTYDNQIEIYSTSQFVKMGDNEIAESFADLLSFAFDAIVEKTYETAVSLLKNKFPRKTTELSRLVDKPEEIENAKKLIEKVFSLRRCDYLNVMKCIHNYVVSIRRAKDDLDLAYSMLVYCIESLAQDYYEYSPVWEDYQDGIRKKLEREFEEIEERKVNNIKGILIQDSHLKLSQRFIRFTKEHVNDRFFTSKYGTEVVLYDDFDLALKNAYQMRSKYVHRLLPIDERLQLDFCTGEGDTNEHKHNVFFTYNGIKRLTREILINFIGLRNSVDYENVDWKKQLPGQAEMQLAPYFWISRDIDKEENGVWAFDRFGGFVNCLVYHTSQIPSMDSVVTKYTKQLQSMSSDNKEAAISLCVLYVYSINNIDEGVRKVVRQVLDENEALLQVCNIYNIVVNAFLSNDCFFSNWNHIEMENVVSRYRNRRVKEKSLRLPAIVEAIIYALVANTYKNLDMHEKQKEYLKLAFYSACNHETVQSLIEEKLRTLGTIDVDVIRSTHLLKL